MHVVYLKGFDDRPTELQLPKAGHVFGKPTSEHQFTGEDTSISKSLPPYTITNTGPFSKVYGERGNHKFSEQ